MRLGPAPHTALLMAGLVNLAAAAWAQESAGEAEIGFQRYYLTSDSREIANVYGLTLGLRQFIPRLGVLSVNLAPAASSGRFRTGESFAELTQVPLAGQYWTFRGGDVRLPGRPLDVPFNNLYYPQISVRGGWIEATHGTRTFGFLYGAETLQAGIRLPLRLKTPQTVAGAYFRQQAGERLLLGVRVLQLSTDLEKLRTTPRLAVQNNPFGSALTGTLSTLYTIAGPFKWYSELGWSGGSGQPLASLGNTDRLSAVSGPLLETSRLTLRANYVHQTASYLPLLGYAVGDRRGPYGEVHVRPFARLELYGSASDYRNNVARDPSRPTFHSTAHSTGASLRLPGRFSVSGTWSTIRLATRISDSDPWVNGANQQVQIMLSRPFGRHNLRMALREFQQRSTNGQQNQRTAEVGDTVQYGRFTIGGDVRAQQQRALQSKTSLFVRGNVQVNLNRLSLFANIQSGSDLANRTLFATSTLNTTVVGGTLRIGRTWNFNVQAYRNKLVSTLNPQNIFVLQGQGVAVPTVLSALNQWSLYIRMTKQFQWGALMPSGSSGLADYAMRQNPLKGTVEGFVRADRRGVEGIPVALDRALTVLTDSDGRFRFEGVGEGARTVGLALNELPADYNAGPNTESTVVVKPGKLSRVDLDVVVVSYMVYGRVVAPEGADLDSIVLKLLPTGRYTTPDRQGRFFFYNVNQGSYEVALAEETLPENAVLKTASKEPVSAVSPGTVSDDTPQVLFEFEMREPEKPVRQLILPARTAEIPDRIQPQPMPPDQPVDALLLASVYAQAAGLPEVVLPAPPTPVSVDGPIRSGVIPPAPLLRPDTSAPPATAQQLNRQGRALTAAGKLEEAVAVLTQAIQVKPDYALAYNARGYAQLLLTRYAQAVSDFTEAIRLNPEYVNAYQNRAAAKRAMGDLAGAKADSAKAGVLQ